MSDLSMRQSELAALRGALEHQQAALASGIAARLVALYPLDPEVRLLAAREALARPDELVAGAHLFFVPENFPGRPEAATPLVGEIFRILQRDPLRAFLLLELRDVPDLELVPEGPRGYLAGLLENLETRGYDRRRLDALLYERRRRLPISDRLIVTGCLSAVALGVAALLVLAGLGLASL